MDVRLSQSLWQLWLLLTLTPLNGIVNWNVKVQAAQTKAPVPTLRKPFLYDVDGILTQLPLHPLPDTIPR